MTYNATEMKEIMEQARHIVVGHRDWFARETYSATMHKFVVKAIDMVRPDDWQKLLLEWPHEADKAKGDMTQVAYTRNEQHGMSNRQTVTNLGKYLKQHFSLLPDHAIRDLVAAAAAARGNFKMVDTTVEMIYHLHRGPTSCMQWEESDGVEGTDGAMHHPYEAYAPEFGWRMAVRIAGGDTVGRALVNNETMTYVRSYKKSEGYSYSDDQLEAWLQEQGYAKATKWRECKLRVIPTRHHDCGFVAPYIDGDYKGVMLSGNHTMTIVHEDDAEYICNNTDGSADDHNGTTCEDCGTRVRDGDGYWVGAWEEELVCEDCCNYSYTYAYGRNGRQYYVHNDSTVYVESQDSSYHDEYLETNNIVQLVDGDYEHTDNAVHIASRDEWYHVNDENIVRCVDTDEFEHKDDAHWHEPSGEWYADADAMPQDDDESESESE